MELCVLGSNSSGNGYILKSDSGKLLLLECGIHPDELKKALDFDLSSVLGCLVTHEHMDHFKYVDQIAKLGINVYASPGTLQDKFGHRYFEVEPQKHFRIGEFEILPFDCNHDARQPYGYVINHPESDKILFLTDSKYTKLKFSGMSHVIVEANHSRQLLDEKLFDGKIQHFMWKRITESHMSIETCLEMIKENNWNEVVNIVLIHLSNSNSHEQNFLNEVVGKTGKKVHIANKGSIINLNKNPF